MYSKKTCNDGYTASSPGVKKGGIPDASYKGAGANVRETRLPAGGKAKGKK